MGDHIGMREEVLSMKNSQIQSLILPVKRKKILSVGKTICLKQWEVPEIQVDRHDIDAQITPIHVIRTGLTWMHERREQGSLTFICHHCHHIKSL